LKLQSIVYERRPSFANARAAAGEGYLNDILLRDAPTQRYDISRADIRSLPAFFGHSIAALAIAAFRLGTRKLRVLDVGGALGGHFGVARTTFGAGLEFDWTVVETPIYVGHGRRLVTTPEVSFVDSIAAVTHEVFDVAYLSSVLPYVEDIDALLSAAPLRAAPFLFISRTGIHEEEIPFLQTVTYDVGVIRYPGRILAKKVLHDRLNSEYDLVTSWEYDQHSVENRPYSAPSMLWRRRA
jgi:putative methyltransferase (TIGR04325 family)